MKAGEKAGGWWNECMPELKSGCLSKIRMFYAISLE